MNSVLHWFDATTGGVAPVDSAGQTYTGWQTQGQLFSSPNLTDFQVGSTSGTAAAYVYTGCADGRVYAFSQAGAGGAWGGEWNGGAWPFPGTANSNSQKVTQSSDMTVVQFEIVTPYAASLIQSSGQAEPSNFNDSSGNTYYQLNSAAMHKYGHGRRAGLDSQQPDDYADRVFGRRPCKHCCTAQECSPAE